MRIYGKAYADYYLKSFVNRQENQSFRTESTQNDEIWSVCTAAVCQRAIMNINVTWSCKRWGCIIQYDQLCFSLRIYFLCLCWIGVEFLNLAKIVLWYLCSCSTLNTIFESISSRPSFLATAVLWLWKVSVSFHCWRWVLWEEWLLMCSCCLFALGYLFAGFLS